MSYFNHNKGQRVEKLKVVENRKVNDLYYVLKLQPDERLPNMVPGQFVNVLVEDSQTTFLRRPISIYDVNYQENSLELLIQIVGDGTAKLSNKNIGDEVDLLYPLGEGFTWDSQQKKVLLIGGGVGLAPLLFLAKELNSKGISVSTLIGGRGIDNIIETHKFEKEGDVFISTEDGSLGEKGLLTAHSIMDRIKDFDKIYTCGPDPMMKAVARIARENQVDCEVSLENLMACGIGACLCCVEDTTTGHRCACTEGPVFNINELKWS